MPYKGGDAAWGELRPPDTRIQSSLRAKRDYGTGTDSLYRVLSLMRIGPTAHALCAVPRLLHVLHMLSVCYNFYTPGVMIFIV